MRNKLAHYQRPHVLIVDEVGYLRLEHGDANRFFQLINRRYTRSSMIITSNRRVSDWAELFGPHVPIDDVARTAGTIGYELLTGLGRRYARRYVSGDFHRSTDIGTLG